MNPLRSLPAALSAACLLVAPLAPAEELTPEQLEAIRARLEALRESLDGHLSSRNTRAGEVFMTAASDPRAATELFLNSHKTVNFDRKGRPESDFRLWRDSQSDRLRDSAFIESLQMQLHYLALSCRAAEAESIDSLFSNLTNYVDRLSRLENLPEGPLTQSVTNSVFAEAYQIQSLLRDNPGWEPVPFNIQGIYERTIFPYLRRESPDALMGAWDRLIEQKSRLVGMIETHQERELRGLRRDQKARTRGDQARPDGVLAPLERDEFTTRTLPRLRWAKLKDMFTYVDQAAGAKAMLDFVEANLSRELGEEFFNEFSGIIGASAAGVPGATEGAPGEPGS